MSSQTNTGSIIKGFIIPALLISTGTILFFYINDTAFSDNKKLSLFIKALLVGSIIGSGWIWNFIYEEKTKDKRFAILIESLADIMLILIAAYTGIKALIL